MLNQIVNYFRKLTFSLIKMRIKYEYFYRDENYYIWLTTHFDYYFLNSQVLFLTNQGQKWFQNKIVDPSRATIKYMTITGAITSQHPTNVATSAYIWLKKCHMEKPQDYTLEVRVYLRYKRKTISQNLDTIKLTHNCKIDCYFYFLRFMPLFDEFSKIYKTNNIVGLEICLYKSQPHHSVGSIK